jgi:hypothetical protein
LENKIMDSFNAVGIAEGFIEAESEEQVIEAWQYLHDTRIGYGLQGFFGRTLNQLLDEGVITA